ncbi:MAG TPA: hypothetical protein VK187_09330, partial [Geobacteraceae bacterium]|nr:hypothetical protein [Geobacteraceae bacterium]
SFYLLKPTPPAQAVQPALSAGASLVVAKLKQFDGRKRPRKRARFLNWIKLQCQGLPNSPLPEAVCQELIKVKMVRESGADVTYEIER